MLSVGVPQEVVRILRQILREFRAERYFIENGSHILIEIRPPLHVYPPQYVYFVSEYFDLGNLAVLISSTKSYLYEYGLPLYGSIRVVPHIYRVNAVRFVSTSQDHSSQTFLTVEAHDDIALKSELISIRNKVSTSRLTMLGNRQRN